MASLKEVKGRILSVKGTLKITSAMKMVASAKLHKAQEVIEGMLPYEQQLSHIFSQFMHSGKVTDSPFMNARPVERIALLVCSSNNSLCGGYNANVIRMLHTWIDEHKDLDTSCIDIIPVGRKVAEAIARMGIKPVGDYAHLADKPSYDEAAVLADMLMDWYREGKVDRVELLYHHFHSTASQTLVQEVFLPLQLQNKGKKSDILEEQTSVGENEEIADYIIEPSVSELVEDLLPSVFRTKLYTVLLDSSASEHAARTMAMQTATDNANDLIQDLTVMYNKSRQQVITNELLDIVGGSMA